MLMVHFALCEFHLNFKKFLSSFKSGLIKRKKKKPLAACRTAVNEAYCGYHLVIRTDIELFCCAPKANSVIH